MSLNIGIVGLPNVGKSTLFNALTQAGAEASNYAFCTVEPNIGVVPVPDERLDRLGELLAPESVTPATIRFVDVAGLVRGASKGEGLGNRFLAHLRETDALVEVVRCFQDDEIMHVDGPVDPVRDVETVELELLLADLAVVEEALPKLDRVVRTDPRSPRRLEFEALSAARSQLERGASLRALAWSPEVTSCTRAYRFLSLKPVLYVANVAEEDLPRGGDLAEALRTRVGSESVLVVSAQIESELAQLEEEERREFLSELGLDRSGIERLIVAGFRLLDLLSFYTIAHDKLQSWLVPRGTSAPEAAGRIHSDMEEGFIRAEIVSCADLMASGGWTQAREAGRLRTEGRDYQIQEGDVVQFLFKN